MACKFSTTFDEQEKIWHGRKEVAPMFHPDCSVGRILFKMMKFKPKAAALISADNDTTMTYEELLRDSVRIAVNLQKLALTQEDIIGIVSGHIPALTSVVLACYFNAIAFHPIYQAHEQAVIRHLYGITRPKVIFCEGKCYAKVKAACEALQLKTRIYTLNEHFEGVNSIEDLLQPSLAEKTFVPVELEKGASQTIYIANSSGTSGLPKAVSCTTQTRTFDGGMRESDYTTLVFSPLDWLGGIAYTLGTICIGVKRVITVKPYTPEFVVYLVEKYKINSILLSPYNVASLVQMPGIEKADLSSLKEVFIAGGAISPFVLRKFRNLLKDERTQHLYNSYGFTEFGGAIATSINVKKPYSVGRLSPGVSVKIISENGQSLGIGEVGEVLAYRKVKVWNGYYGNAEETLKLQDEQMWFHSGDMGYFDEEGELFIVDRKKDILKYQNVHYFPKEIEEVIRLLPDVVEVCVFGNSNETEGDRAAAAIVRRIGSKLTEEQVIQYVAEKFEVKWKRLNGGVFFVESLPRSVNGKILRREIRNLITQEKTNN